MAAGLPLNVLLNADPGQQAAMMPRRKKVNNKIGIDLNNRQTAIDKQIEQWILVGPLLMLGALLVLFLIPIRPILLTSIALIGLPLCWKWQLPAAGVATAALIAALVYQLAFSTGALPYWHAGFAITIALTLWITAFCSKEVEHLFTTFQEGTAPVSSKTQLIKNELANLAKKKGEEQKAAEAKIANLQSSLINHEKQLKVHTESAIECKKQLDTLQLQNQELQKSLSEATLNATSYKEQCGKLTESLDNEKLRSEELTVKCADFQNLESKITALELLRMEECEIWETSTSTLEHNIVEYEAQILSKNQILEEAQRNLSRLEEQNAGLLQEIFQRRHECTRLKQHAEELNEALNTRTDNAHEEALLQSANEIQAKEAVILEQKLLLQKLQEDLNLNQLELSECRQKADELLEICAQKEALLVEQIEKAQNATPDRQLRKLEGLYKQLKVQFTEKSLLLDCTRQELFITKEALDKSVMERAEKEIEGKQADYLTSIEKQLQKTTDELITTEKRHLEEIDALQTLIKDLSPTPKVAAAPVSVPNESKTKTRSPKKTKTTNWANAILSRCAETSE